MWCPFLWCSRTFLRRGATVYRSPLVTPTMAGISRPEGSQMTARAPVRTTACRYAGQSKNATTPNSSSVILPPSVAIWTYPSCCDRTRPAATRGSGVIPHIGSWCPHFGLAPTRPPGHAATDEGRRPGPGARRPRGIGQVPEQAASHDQSGHDQRGGHQDQHDQNAREITAVPAGEQTADSSVIRTRGRAARAQPLTGSPGISSCLPPGRRNRTHRGHSAAANWPGPAQRPPRRPLPDPGYRRHQPWSVVPADFDAGDDEALE